jgi:CelD/BcsL family acetyltransferase involved in cellulose biosynthesis
VLSQRAHPDSETVDREFTLLRPRGVEAIERLRSAWESLPTANPMQHYIWARACAEAFTGGTVQIVSVGGESPRAMVALFSKTAGKELAPLGAELYEPADFPCANESAARDLAEAIARLGKTVFFNDLAANSLFLQELRRACGRRLVARPRPGHPWIDLDDSWLEPESHLNSGRRSDLRRARRNAEKLGTLRVEITVPDAASLEPLLAEAFRVEAANWKGRQGSALALDPQVGTFYRRFAEAACERGWLRVGLLWIGERAVAMQLAVEMSGAFWLFKMGYDEEFSRCSPGQLLMVESLRFARQRGCARYELMGQSEAWNQVWTQQVHPALTVRIHPPGISGWAAIGADLARVAIASRIRRGGGNGK